MASASHMRWCRYACHQRLRDNPYRTPGPRSRGRDDKVTRRMVRDLPEDWISGHRRATVPLQAALTGRCQLPACRTAMDQTALLQQHERRVQLVGLPRRLKRPRMRWTELQTLLSFDEVEPQLSAICHGIQRGRFAISGRHPVRDQIASPAGQGLILEACERRMQRHKGGRSDGTERSAAACASCGRRKFSVSTAQTAKAVTASRGQSPGRSCHRAALSGQTMSAAASRQKTNFLPCNCV